MTIISTLLAGALLWLPRASAQLPYNPTQLILSPDNSKLYQFSNAVSGSTLVTIDVSNNIGPTSHNISSETVPFLKSQTQSFIAVADVAGINVLVGDCQDTTDGPTLWRMPYNSTGGSNAWTEHQVQRSDTTAGASFLAAGFSFSATNTTTDIGSYVFGGMCPQKGGNTTAWTSSATYSNAMAVLSPGSDSDYSLTAKVSPPIAEAGLTITPLEPVVSYSSAGKKSQEQSFVLLGGHTSTAFINMSQVAVFSLPDATWSFKGVNQPDAVQGELMKRDNTIVEPRSGHSAVLSEDGTQIFVVGGWVGDVTNPASPQFAILEMGDQYGTASTWSWTIPNQDGNPFSMNSGVYGHSAVMLKGGVMMVNGGTSIIPSKTKRDTQQYFFYNTTSSSWIASYTNPNVAAKQSANHTSSKTGLGAGLGVGLTVVIVIAVAGFLFARRRKQKRMEREKRLRAMALGSGKYHSGSQISASGTHTDMRSASWGNAQERQIEHIGQAVSWPLPESLAGQDALEKIEEHHEFDNPDQDQDLTRGLRRNMHSGRPAGFGSHFSHLPVGPGSVFRIDEEEEIRSIKSPRPLTATSRRSDPFKDPPTIETTNADAEERRREVKGWVEDWQSAAINLSRSPSQARTYSNLSQAHSNSQSDSDRGRLSPDKTDRTGSNLSERSTLSNQSTQSHSGFGRTLSQRSVSAGYALFAGAAAAMSRMAGTKDELDRSGSRRTMSMGSTRHGRPANADNQSLLRGESPTKSEHGAYYTPPESPIKDYKNYSRRTQFASRSRTRGVLGSVRRVFTGTSQVDVDARVEHYEEKEKEIENEIPEMTQTSPHDTTMSFWQGKKGARDWEREDGGMTTSTIRRRSGGRHDNPKFDRDGYDGEDWDVETAIQKRVVQVMFTVPKEKLRVVNADALSLISRSDIGDREEEQLDTGVNRMSSVKEGDEQENEMNREKAR